MSALSADPEIAISCDIASEVSISNARNVGSHDCSLVQSSWVLVSEFDVNSNSPSGVTISAEWLNGFGWSHGGTGTTQDTDFNNFDEAKIDSTDTGNYVGSKSIGSILPVSWNQGSSMNTRTINNGTQSDIMSGWRLGVYLMWPASATLNSGVYTQNLTVTITAN